MGPRAPHPRAKQLPGALRSTSPRSTPAPGRQVLRRTFFEVVRSSVEDLLVRYRERIPDLRRLDEARHLPGPERAHGLCSRAPRGLARPQALRAHRRIRQLRQPAPGRRRGGALRVDCPRHRLRPQLLRGAQGGHGDWGPGPYVHHRRFADHARRPFERLQHHHAHLAAGPLRHHGRLHPRRRRAGGGRVPRGQELREDPRLADRGRLLETLEHYYDGYRFSERATERVFNSDLVVISCARSRTPAAIPGRCSI